MNIDSTPISSCSEKELFSVSANEFPGRLSLNIEGKFKACKVLTLGERIDSINIELKGVRITGYDPTTNSYMFVGDSVIIKEHK